MPDIFAHQVIAHGVDELAGLEVAEPVQQLGHLQGHRGLPGPWLAGETHMQARPGRLKAEPAPGAVDQQERGDLLDLVLHRDEPDQLVVQVGEDLIHAGGLALVGQGDDGVRVQQRGGPAGPPGRPGGPGWSCVLGWLCVLGWGAGPVTSVAGRQGAGPGAPGRPGGPCSGG